MRAEEDEDDYVVPTPTLGSAEAGAVEFDHTDHTYLYVPDLSSETHWSAHRVPTKEPPRERRPLGFRR